MRVFALIATVVLAISQITSSAEIGLPLQSNLENLAKNPLTTRLMEKEITAFIGCVQGLLQEGLPEHGLPSLNPLSLDEASVDITNLNITGLAGHLDLTNLVLGGAVNWDITKLKVTATLIPVGANVDITLKWPAVFGVTNYNGDLVVGEHHLFGTGFTSFDITNFAIAVRTKVTILPAIKIRTLSIKPSLGSLRAKITGLYDDEVLSEQISNDITNNASKWLNDNAAAIDKELSDRIKDLINNAAPGGDPKPPGEETIIDVIVGICSK